MADAISDQELFRAVADAGSITGAGPRLGLSTPAVSRRLTALERRLGVRLVERTARRFQLTAEGEKYWDGCSNILTTLQELENEISAVSSSAQGVLRIGAPGELGRRYIAPLLAQFHARHVGVRAYLALGDMGWEVARDRLDVALRVGRPEDPTILARRVATVPRVLCASPSFFARMGTPKIPVDLKGFNCLLLERRNHVWNSWRFMKDGFDESVMVSGGLSSSSGDVLHQWALDGLGLSFEAFWDVAEDLRSGRLVQCLGDYDGEEAELFATCLPGRHMPVRVRLFIDYIAEAIRTIPIGPSAGSIGHHA